MDIDAIARLTSEVRMLLSHPAVAWFFAVAAVFICMFIVYKTATRTSEVAARANEQRAQTLVEGNRTLEEIRSSMMVQTSHMATTVEAMRGIVTNLERQSSDARTHDRDSIERHRENMRALEGFRKDREERDH